MKYKFFELKNSENLDKAVERAKICSNRIKEVIKIETLSGQEEIKIEDLLVRVCILRNLAISNPNKLEKWEKWGKAQHLTMKITDFNERVAPDFRIWTKEEARQKDYEQWLISNGNDKKGKYKQYIGYISWDCNISCRSEMTVEEMGKLLGLNYMLKTVFWTDDEECIDLGIID